MKKLTIKVLCLALVVMTFSATETFAQRIKFKNGKAKVSATVQSNGKKVFTVSGRDFGKLSIKQTNGEKFKYEIRRGSEFLSSGHSTGFTSVNSDGRSVYKIIIINEENKARPIALSFINDGTEPL